MQRVANNARRGMIVGAYPVCALPSHSKPHRPRASSASRMLGKPRRAMACAKDGAR